LHAFSPKDIAFQRRKYGCSSRVNSEWQIVKVEKWNRQAALLPSVRKGYAFPASLLPTTSRGSASRRFFGCIDGKAEPFRTEGGKAASIDTGSARFFRLFANCCLLFARRFTIHDS
jgi:hypothetical protein